MPLGLGRWLSELNEVELLWEKGKPKEGREARRIRPTTRLLTSMGGKAGGRKVARWTQSVAQWKTSVWRSQKEEMGARWSQWTSQKDVNWENDKRRAGVSL